MVIRTKVAPEVVRERLAKEFLALDIRALIEQYGDVLLPGGDSKGQLNGPCPWRARGECTAKENGFTVWPVLSDRGRHYYCRQCRKSGTILDLVQQLHNKTFRQACELIGIGNVYASDGKWSAPAPLDRNTPASVDPRRIEQLALLHTWYPRMQKALSHDRARAYLAQRAIPFDLADSAGLGYIPALSSMTVVTPEVEKLRRWCDRMVFPVYTTSGERCYAGRSLYLWEPGMDEDEHKELLDGYNARMKAEGGYTVPRWLYTHLQGFFNWQVVASAEDSLIFVEGPFDVLACLACGIGIAISIGTTGVDAGAIPLRIDRAIMALDIDGPGRLAANKLAKAMRRKGIEVEIAAPMGKDWSAAYRLHGRVGLAPLLLSGVTAQAVEQSNIPIEQITEITSNLASNARIEMVERQVQPSELPELPEQEELEIACWVCGADVEEYSPVTGRAYCHVHYMHRDNFSPEEIGAIVARSFTGWNVELIQGQPVKTVEPSIAGAGDFWAYVERQNARPPLNKQGRPMMSRERWAKIRAKQLAWRPNPKLLAHRVSWEASR